MSQVEYHVSYQLCRVQLWKKRVFDGLPTYWTDDIGTVLSSRWIEVDRGGSRPQDELRPGLAWSIYLEVSLNSV